MSSFEQKKLIFDRLNYKPSHAQEPIHRSEARFRLVAGGWRAGKSKLAAMEYMGRFWETPLLWIVAADYNRTKAEFNYICESLAKLGIPYVASARVDPGDIVIAGGKFKVSTKSASDPKTLAMEAPDGILVCEASQIDYDSWLRLRGRAAEKRGWILLEGSFESSLGWYSETFSRWQTPNPEGGESFSLPSWTNLVVYPGGREDPEIKALEVTYSKEAFAEWLGGVPCSPKGLIFSEFRNDLHTGMGGKYEFDPALDVQITIDPGFSAAYVVLACQRKEGHLYVFDEIYERGLITSDIIKVCQQKPWWHKVSGGVIDIEAIRHMSMTPVAEVWAKEAKIRLRSKRVPIDAGIERVKSFLLINPITNQPLLHINTRCRGLISEFGGCPNPITGMTAVYKYKEDSSGTVIGIADKDNHSSKALSYLLVDLFGYSITQRKSHIRFV